jgi:SAM-dependent methyltransferase
MPFDDRYFSSNAYKDISFSRYTQYWWSNRFYAILAGRYGKPGDHLLEIGSGLGHLVGQLEKSFSTYAVDVNRWALTMSKLVAPHTALQIASAESLPFSGESFEVVIIKHVVEHLPYPEKALAEIGRISAPGGLLIFSTPNLASRLRPLKGEKWIGFQDPTHISLKPPLEWLEIIKNSGFCLVKTFSDGFWDVPYIPVIPNFIQKLFFGFLGGVQALIGFPFLPMRWGESIMVVARKPLTDA